MKYFWIVFSLLVIGGVYYGICYLLAYLEVRAAPREPMVECQKHGLFRKKHLVTFLDTEWCPRCVHEKIQVPLDSTVDFKEILNHIDKQR
jgi:hypothetical protein